MIPPPPMSGIDLGPLHLSMYGLLIAIGAYVAVRLTVRRYGTFGGDPDLAERATLVALGSGFLGARVAYILPRLDAFVAEPHHLFMIWNGGLAFLGGVVVAVPVTWWYVRRQRGDVAAMVDAVAPALPLAHAIGRWGCYFNQELYGRPTDVPWALQIEPAHRVAGYSQFQTFHPTFLYESLWNLALFGVLMWADRRRIDGQRWLRRGTLGFLYLAGYGVGRSWIEWLRIDVPDTYAGLTRNGWTALLMAVSGVIGALLWQRRGDDFQPSAFDVADDAGEQDRASVPSP